MGYQQSFNTCGDGKTGCIIHSCSGISNTERLTTQADVPWGEIEKVPDAVEQKMNGVP
jgi:uncharacterized metal-binding protein